MKMWFRNGKSNGRTAFKWSVETLLGYAKQAVGYFGMTIGIKICYFGMIILKSIDMHFA